MKLRAIIACAAMFSGPTVEAAEVSPRLPPIEVFFKETARSAESLSPDGSMVAYLGPDDCPVKSLWVVNAKEPGNLRKISPLNHLPIHCFFWIGNDKLLWQCDGANSGRRLHLSNLKTGETRELLAGETRAISLHGVVNTGTPCILIGLSEAGTAFPDLFRLRLTSTAVPEPVCANPHQILTWAWDRQGTPVAGLRWTQTGAKELLNLLEKPPRVVFHAEPDDDLRLLMASSDGSRALVLTDRDSDFTHLEWINLASGARQPFGGDPLGRVDLGGVFTAGDDVLAVSHSDEMLRWHATDPSFTSILQTLNDSSRPDSMTILGMDESRTRVLFKRFSARNPGTICLHDTKTGNTHLLWHERPDLDPASLSDTRPIQYPTSDGTTVPAYLTLPNCGKAPWPLVVFPHGGPRMRSHAGFDGRVQFLASRGYAVLQPNFRGSRGYGKTYMNAGDRQWGKGIMQTDLTDGVDHLVREGTADPSRVAILGGSYGGYAALAGLAFTPDRYAAGICLFGISDLVDFATNQPPEWQAYAGDTNRRLGDPSTLSGRATLLNLSPVKHAANFRAPLLIYHGARDNLIPVTHTQRMAHALKLSGKKVESLIASDESHGFSNPESEMAVYRAIELFLHRHLGGKTGPAPSESVTRRIAEFQESKK